MVYVAYRGARLFYYMYTTTNDARWAIGTGMWVYDNCKRALSSLASVPLAAGESVTDMEEEWEVVNHPEAALGGPLKWSG